MKQLKPTPYAYPIPQVRSKPKTIRKIPWYFRKEWFLVPLTIFACLLISPYLQAPCRWEDLLDLWGIEERVRFSELTTWAILLIAVVAIIRLIKGPRKEEDE